jgi:hypothetical protein
MNPLDRLARELARLGSHLLRIDPALHHSPTSDVEHDGPDAAFDSLPSHDERRLPAAPQPEEPLYAATVAARKIDAAGGAVDLTKLRPDQEPLVADLARIGRKPTGHQIHRNPDEPCPDCCAALDFVVAGWCEDADEWGEAGRP